MIELSEVIVAEICDKMDSYIIDQITEKGTIGDLYDLGEDALMGFYEGNYYRLANTIDQVMDYFVNCNQVACDPNAPVVVAPNDGVVTGRVVAGDLELFPNPASDYINVKLNYKAIDNVTVRIYSSLGQLVYEKSMGGVNNEMINVNALTSGLYHLVVSNQDEIINTEKFLKQE